MDLYQHQKDFLKKNPNKSSLVWSCGTGKTRAAIEWSNQYGFDVLIICPKALKANWEREAKRWSSKKIMFQGKVLAESVDGYKIVTKEEFRRDWDKLPAYAQLICDEVHNGFLTPNFKSQMSKALKGYLKKHNVPRVLLLSATVYTSSPWNIYNLAWYTGHQWDYRKFKYEYFDDVWMGPKVIPVVKKDAQPRLAKLVQKIASVVDIHDVMDVPLQHHLDPEYFALTKEQQKAIKGAYDPLPIVRYTYQHEIENGVLLGNEFRKFQLFDCDKNSRIYDICREHVKVAIVCRYNMQIAELEEGLLSEGFEVLVIQGSVSNRDEVTLQAEKLDKVIVIIQADCAEGYQLPSFELCIFASMSYSYTKYEQICGRFLRMDKPSRTTFIYLLTEGDSMDQAVYDSIKNKQDFQIELYGK